MATQEQRLRWIVESAPVCLARVARDGTILAMNTAARAMMGASRGNDVLRKSLLSFVADDDREPTKRFIDQVCVDQAGSLEFRLSSISGVVRTVEARGVALPTASAEADPTAFLVLRDVTARKRFEESVAERLEAESGRNGVESDDAVGDRTRLTERIAELEGAHEALRAERERLLANLEEARTNLEKTKTDGARPEPADSLRQLETERAELQRILDEERTQHEAEIAEALTARNELARRLRETESQGIRSAEDARENAARQLHAWKTECHRLETERQALQASLADLQTALDQRLRGESEGGVAERAPVELEQQVREAEGRTRALEEQAREARRERDEFEAHALRAQRERDEFETQTRLAQRRFEELEQQLRDAESRQRTLEEPSPAAGPDLEALEAQARETQRLREELERVLCEGESSTQRAAADARDSIASLELQLKDVDRARAQALADRDETAAALRRERARHAEFESDEISIRRVLELRLQHAEAEVKRLTAEVGALPGTVRSRTSRHDGLLRELLESDRHGALAERWIAHSAALEQALDAARTEFQQLAEWARARNGLTPAHQGSTQPAAPPGDDRPEAREPAPRG